ncbi:ATP-binding cassette domain-containing protein [Lutimonas halocynthiae]|uniref:ABC transporter ATP-binding protein n=1 Tax=Lutimonas halocynthiae TaxID=1446477 RepID=UPI0025B3AF1E|nr:ATP-binding cassette domain-containing protein [Lutimonas halocynthiae]MDN3642291.1 ATP-binding cassette domain-containing protein [Lutimonas halocynthiae]
MIEVTDIHKSFGDQEILKGISATFHKGDTSMIIGTSGSGKTVFLKCLLGLFSPEQGDICYDNRHYSKMSLSEKRELRKEIGMVFQGGALFDSETIEDNIKFPLKMFTKQTDEEMRDRVNFVLNRVNLENVNNKFPAELSGGMQKRVAIARAIVMNPKYLFCDEPNSGLDPKTAIIIDNLIQEITDEYQMITIINSHDMNSVMEIGEKIIFLKQGLKEWEGSFKTIFKTNNEAVTDFVYSSNLYKKVREAYNNG